MMTYQPLTYCAVHNCGDIADDEYHFYEGFIHHVWKVCERHCELAISMVESVAEVIEHEGEFR